MKIVFICSLHVFCRCCTFEVNSVAVTIETIRQDSLDCRKTVLFNIYLISQINVNVEEVTQ
jgi:hypothetical protein